MYLYLNEELVPSEHAKISIFDHGYLYGVGLFETFRTYKGHPFLLSKHLDRLAQSCKQIGLNWSRDDERLSEQIETLLRVNGLQDGYFRYNLSAGAQPIGLPRQAYQQLTEALFVKRLPPLTTSKRLYTVTIPRNTPEGAGRLKSHHYLNNLLAHQETPADAEGVFLTKEGKVAEGVVSNLFFVKGDELYTPSLATGILAGITREWVLKAASFLGIQVHEGEYTLSFAQEAEEVFITNSIQELVPVTHWDEHEYLLGQQQVINRFQQLYDRCKYRLHYIDDLQP